MSVGTTLFLEHLKTKSDPTFPQCVADWDPPNQRPEKNQQCSKCVNLWSRVIDSPELPPLHTPNPQQPQPSKPQQSVAKQTNITVRRLNKTKGGVIIPCPLTMEDLLRVGGDKLGITAVKARTSEEGLAEIGDISIIPKIVFLTNEEEEKEF